MRCSTDLDREGAGGRRRLLQSALSVLAVVSVALPLSAGQPRRPEFRTGGLPPAQ